MEPTYSPLEYRSNRGTLVYLNDQPLTDGTWVEVLYPDGEAEIERIYIIRRYSTETEQGGGTWACIDESAVVLTTYHDLSVRFVIPAGTMMRRVKINGDV